MPFHPAALSSGVLWAACLDLHSQVALGGATWSPSRPAGLQFITVLSCFCRFPPTPRRGTELQGFPLSPVSLAPGAAPSMWEEPHQCFLGCGCMCARASVCVCVHTHILGRATPQDGQWRRRARGPGRTRCSGCRSLSTSYQAWGPCGATASLRPTLRVLLQAGIAPLYRWPPGLGQGPPW